MAGVRPSTAKLKRVPSKDIIFHNPNPSNCSRIIIRTKLRISKIPRRSQQEAHAHAHTYIRIYTHTHTHTYAHAYAHTHMHIHTHTHTHSMHMHAHNIIILYPTHKPTEKPDQDQVSR